MISKRNLQGRLTMVVLLAASLFAVVACALTYQWTFSQGMVAGRDSLTSLAGAMERTAAIGAYTRDDIMLQELVDGIASNRFAARVAVQVGGHTMAQAYHGGNMGAPGSKEKFSRDALKRELRSPFDQTEMVGELLIEPDARAMAEYATEQARTLAILMLAQIAAVATILNLAAQRLVTNPIGRIARQMAQMSPGTAERMTIPTGHEADQIGQLVLTANALLNLHQLALSNERMLRNEVEAMEAQYRQIFDSTSAGIFVLNPQGQLINANPTVFKLLGHDDGHLRELRGGEFVQHVFAQPERVQAMIDQAVRHNETTSADLEILSPTEGSRWVHCLISVQAGKRNSDSGLDLVEGVIYDVTERKRVEHAARHKVDHDALTGLSSRSACETAIDTWCGCPSSTNASFTAMYIDLDGFKQINDQWGHKAGDAVLVACAQRMRAVVRRSFDIVGRLGGDEFLVVLFRMAPNEDAVGTIAQALIDSLARPISIEGHGEAKVGLSIGIASFSMHGHTRAEVLQAADEAMYQVKRNGKNSFAVALPRCSAGAPAAHHAHEMAMPPATDTPARSPRADAVATPA